MPVNLPTTYSYNAFDRARLRADLVTGERYHALRQREQLEPAEDDTTVEWRAGSRLERISFAAWGTPELWWLLLDVNDIVDEYRIAVGTTLRVPSLTRVARLLSTPPPRSRG